MKTILAKGTTNNLKFIRRKLFCYLNTLFIGQADFCRFCIEFDALRNKQFNMLYIRGSFTYFHYNGSGLRKCFYHVKTPKYDELQNYLYNRKYTYFDQVTTKTNIVKDALPYGLSNHFGPLSVARAIGKHNPSFNSKSTNKKVSYTYLGKKLFIIIRHYSCAVIGYGTIKLINFTGSVSEINITLSI